MVQEDVFFLSNSQGIDIPTRIANSTPTITFTEEEDFVSSASTGANGAQDIFNTLVTDTDPAAQALAAPALAAINNPNINFFGGFYTSDPNPTFRGSAFPNVGTIIFMQSP